MSAAAELDGFPPADSGDEPCSANPGSAGNPEDTTKEDVCLQNRNPILFITMWTRSDHWGFYVQKLFLFQL